MAVAARMLKIADDQGQAAVKLIEAAAEGLTAATADLNHSLSRLLDIRV